MSDMEPASSLARVARRAGVTSGGDASLDAVDARRSQLWLLSFVVSGALAASLVLIAGGAGSGLLGAGWVPRLCLLLLVVTFFAYVAEKERDLRALSRLLVEERARADALAEAATRDPLTGLLTADAFHDRLAAALGASKEHDCTLALVLLDLDHFRRLNERHGASACDRALVAIAERARANVRHHDAVARLRGDQFAMILEAVDDADVAAAVVRRVLDAIGQPLVELDGAAVRATAGVVVHRGGRKEQPADLVRDAELARTIAKRRGGHLEVWDRTATART